MSGLTRELFLAVLDQFQEMEIEVGAVTPEGEDCAAWERRSELRLSLIAVLRAAVEQSPDPAEALVDIAKVSSIVRGTVLRNLHGSPVPHEVFGAFVNTMVSDFAVACGGHAQTALLSPRKSGARTGSTQH